MKQRLFVDLDGTCAVWQPVAEEQLFEKGYYRNLPEYKNVVAAVNDIVANHPEIDVYVLSKYFTTSDYALDDYTKNFEEWQPPAHGIKLLNGINHTKETWQDNRISLMRNPKDLADCIVRVMTGKTKVMDNAPQKERDSYIEDDISRAIDAVMEQNELMDMELPDYMPE